MKKTTGGILVGAAFFALSACTAPLYGNLTNGEVASMSDGKHFDSDGAKFRLAATEDAHYFMGIPIDAKEIALATTNKELSQKCQGGRLENIAEDVSLTNFAIVQTLHFREEATCVLPQPAKNKHMTLLDNPGIRP